MQSHWTIRKQMTAACGVFLLLILILGGGGFVAVRTLGWSLNKALGETARKEATAAEMATLFQRMKVEARGSQISVMTHHFEKNPSGECSSCHSRETMLEHQANFRKLAQKVEERLEELGRWTLTPAQKSAAETIRRRLPEWVAAYDEYLRLAGSGAFDKAHDIAIERMTPALTEAGEAAQAIVSEEDKSMAAAAGEADSQVRWSSNLSLLLIGVSVLVAAGVIRVAGGISRRLRRSAEAVQEGVLSLSSASRQLKSSSQSLADGAARQARSVDEVDHGAKQTNELTRSGQQRLSHAAGVATRMDGHVETLDRTLKETLESMHSIAESAGEIARIIRAIDEIAFQTNILSLNAAVEAARAGAAGQGFAVVAAEVRNLSQRSAQAANETTDLVNAAIDRTRRGRAKLDELAGEVQAVSMQVREVASLIEHLNESGKTQADSLGTILSSVEQLRDGIQTTASSAEQSAAAAEELDAQTGSLASASSELQDLVGA